MFSVHTTPEEYKYATITGHFGFVSEKDSVFEKLRFQNVLRPDYNEKPAFSIPQFEERFETLRFRRRLV